MQPVVDCRCLPLSDCKIFGEKLVYLFYGGVFYRRHAVPTNKASIMPVAVVFRPDALQCVDRYYPFDTGAAHWGKYGKEWTQKLEPFKPRFRVEANGGHQVVANMVRHCFGTNEDYLFNDPNPVAKELPDPFPVLHEFLSTNFSDTGIDQRFRRIEAHSKVPVLLDHLLWIGYPKSEFEPIIDQLVAQCDPRPATFRYKAFPLAPPNELAAIMQHEAHEAIIKQFL